MHETVYTDLTLFPSPVVVISAGTMDKPALSTYIWVSQFNEDPPIFAIGMKTKRNTYKIIKEKKAFAINIPDVSLLKKVDLIGTSSSVLENKKKEYDLDIGKAEKVDAIVWKECPIIYECEFISEIPFDDHVMVIGKAVLIKANEKIMEGITAVQEVLNPLMASYTEKNYYSLGEKLKPWGFTRY